ncbi:12502_t:CDS:2 [Gigaspora margarita]|uniref:12502_t:CDS:1 n=1 Tax=Gigaspora margarita TaxID=4874 RepID=A0ABN7UMV5_GIGMA|nr:12502_t:CDS:2 [Gigaspora margarita]
MNIIPFWPRPILLVIFFILFFSFWNIEYFYAKPKEILSDKEINRKYCDADKCKFMFTYHVVEQETQSNRHFISFIQIAELLGRTMVLTNVGQSRVSSLKNFSFDFYYDVDELSKKFPKVKFISQYEFHKWTEERYNKPDVMHAYLENSRLNPNYTVQDNTAFFDRLLSEYRMDRFDLRLNNSAIFKRIHIGNMGHSSRYGNKNVKLKKRLAAELKSNAEVMLIKHDLTLKTGITNIYLATDYPLVSHKKNNKILSQSDTFMNIRGNHHTAMKILNSSFNVNTWVSTHALDYLQLYPMGGEQIQEELSGGGIQGIFDKLMLINADYIIAGPKECCRIVSSYTYNVVEARQELFRNNRTIKNTVDHWEVVI